ncbi:FCGBP protein, partial [Baryphthengus martii]|nr:FCGBP protein [Baryphthengus martii]
CEVTAGTPACLPERVTACRLAAGHHYQTFDGRTFDVTGACAYTLSQTFHEDPALPVFDVEVRNEPEGDLKVPGVGALVVRVYGVAVAAVKAENGLVRVNAHRSHLPVSLADGKLRLRQQGRALLIQTDFGLKVLYDWADRVVLKLPAAFSGKIRGLCGN